MGGYYLPSPYGKGYMGRNMYSSSSSDMQAKVLKSIGGKHNLNKMFNDYDGNKWIDIKYGNNDGIVNTSDLEREVNSRSLASHISANIDSATNAIASGARPTKPGDAELEAEKLAEEKNSSNKFIMQTGYITDPDDKLRDGLGRSVQLADEQRQIIAFKQTMALRKQINIINKTPPLVLLVNPSRFERNYEQGSDSSSKGRYSNIVQNWLERPMTINGGGVTSGQYIVNAEGSGGLTNVLRVHSLSYASLLSLLMIYKNNGILYAGDESDRGIPILGMSIFIYYDQHVYIGSFDTFSIADTADKPFHMSYEFRFKVRYDMSVPTNGLNSVVDSSIVNGMRF
ncbi:MAG TPA: hypothetical protein ENI76_00965 [Ignavibacteria bacterium]|nr:hypothetical protein [Ignavibacteria bacterium]